MRVFTATLSTESNSFSPIPTTLESFRATFHAPAGTHPDRPRPTSAQVPVLRQVAKERGWTVIEGLCTHAEPAAPVRQADYEELREELLRDLRAALPLDMVVLGLHGAMIAVGCDDCEGDILERVRGIVGPGVPIGAHLDPHCHLTPAMLASADVLVCYKEFPHTDFLDRAREVVDLTAATAAGTVRPVMSTFDCHMIASMPTSRQPMRGFVDRIKALEGKDGVLSVSVVHGFPYGDVAEVGTRILVVADGDAAKGEALARDLGHELYRMRRDLAPVYRPLDEALDHVLAGDGGPFVIADPADNAGGGAPSDNTNILRRLLERGIENAAIGPIWDPQAVGFCHGFGEGARLRLRLGGKAGFASGAPVDAEAEVIALADELTQSFSGALIGLGRAAAVRVGGVEVLLNANRTQARAPDMFANCGIDPTAKKLLVVKSTNHFHAAFAPIAKEILYVDSGGPLPRDFRKVAFTRVERPMWPMVDDPLGLGRASEPGADFLLFGSKITAAVIGSLGIIFSPDQRGCNAKAGEVDVHASTSQGYRAYAPPPFRREERDRVEILFGGLHWRAERVLGATFENLGYRARPLPVATKDDLLAGRELADIGQCCPTSFTTGNLANFLRAEAGRIGKEEVANRYVYVTAGSCGACRFGQYHQSYELALRNLGMESFRLFLMDQNRMDQGAAAGGGLEINMPLTLGVVWAILCTDVLQSLEYRTRPYEVRPGQTDEVVADSVAYLCEMFRRRPKRGKKWGALAWHLGTGYFVKALREVFRRFEAIEVDRLQAKPVVKITGEFYLQTVEGDPNYNIHRWLEAEGAEVYPAAVAVWLDYWMRFYVQGFEDYIGIDRYARAKIAAVKTLQRLFRWTYDRMRAALGNIPHEMPDQYELRALAAPHFHSRLSGGEGDMLVGKALWSHLHKKAHMICELSPYSCMPNTMSVGAMAGVIGRHPDLLYAPLEIKGDAEVHALSRCQMILTEAKKRAQRELDGVLERTGLSLEEARARQQARPELRRATYRVPHHGVAGTAANLVLHLAEGARA